MVALCATYFWASHLIYINELIHPDLNIAHTALKVPLWPFMKALANLVYGQEVPMYNDTTLITLPLHFERSQKCSKHTNLTNSHYVLLWFNLQLWELY